MADVSCPKCRCVLTHTVEVEGKQMYRCFLCGHIFDDDELWGQR
jgi:transposase-like protein